MERSFGTPGTLFAFGSFGLRIRPVPGQPEPWSRGTETLSYGSLLRTVTIRKDC